eukprot:TRINITY_DN18806_c0_g1_i1.p1 TRINITY_DN18806_c0_g1~~TRINITY_DN18806_c0_g1_i1.p1  ORF type:complete len:158 (-),score=19.34 TRINITY_DN18806_c0_g1_i1:504-977(-)
MAKIVGQPVGIASQKPVSQNYIAGGYEENPEFTCIYYNENDPRMCVCGRHTLKCGKAEPVANLATPGGKIICCGGSALPIGCCVLVALLGSKEDEVCRSKPVPRDCRQEDQCVWCGEYCGYKHKDCERKLLAQESSIDLWNTSKLTMRSAASVTVYD